MGSRLESALEKYAVYTTTNDTVKLAVVLDSQETFDSVAHDWMTPQSL